MVYAFNTDLESIKITTKEELDVFLEKYDKSNYYLDKVIGLILVPDSFIENPEEVKDLVLLQNAKLDYTFLIGETEASEGFNIYYENGFPPMAIAKNDFYKLFDIQLSYKC